MKINPIRFLVLIGLAFVFLPAPCRAMSYNPIDAMLIDANGRRITLEQPFKRIIALYGAHAENLFAMGAGDQVAGVNRHADWPVAVKNKPVFSSHDDPEKFIAARPDLVLIRPMIDRGYGPLMRQLEKYGIVVVSLQPSSHQEMLIYWRVLGKLSGRSAAAQAMIAHFESATATIRTLAAKIPVKKRVYLEAIHSRMRTFAPNAMAVFALETAGGVNVAADAVSRRGTNIADYGKERILSRAHEIDVFIAQTGPMNRPCLESIQNEPGFGVIKAVQNGEIYTIDEKLISRPTLRLLCGICRFGRILYPQVFDDETMATGCADRIEPAAAKGL
ncbi:MAG: ABC transporter substrate-binding protein [Desulfobacteraceae bacterium]|nr:ABC transporter substrate-binding protein [Desulfobacteraceae bacterium]